MHIDKKSNFNIVVENSMNKMKYEILYRLDFLNTVVCSFNMSATETFLLDILCLQGQVIQCRMLQ